jgi:zinc finger protein
MATAILKEDPKPDGAAFDDFFESIGKKTENLTVKDEPTDGAAPKLNDEEDQRVVDEIESLCMNCHENVQLHLQNLHYLC